jgi:hypothetical protein
MKLAPSQHFFESTAKILQLHKRYKLTCSMFCRAREGFHNDLICYYFFNKNIQNSSIFCRFHILKTRHFSALHCHFTSKVLS